MSVAPNGATDIGFGAMNSVVCGSGGRPHNTAYVAAPAVAHVVAPARSLSRYSSDPREEGAGGLFAHSSGEEHAGLKVIRIFSLQVTAHRIV